MKNLGKRRKLARMIRADLGIYLTYLSHDQYNEGKAKQILLIAINDMLALTELDGVSTDDNDG